MYKVIECSTNRSKPAFNYEKAIWVTKSELLEYIRIGRSRVTNLMNSGDWKEGIHWVRPTGKQLLFCLPLILDWMVNHADPQAHERAIANFLKSLPSNQ